MDTLCFTHSDNSSVSECIWWSNKPLIHYFDCTDRDYCCAAKQWAFGIRFEVIRYVTHDSDT